MSFASAVFKRRDLALQPSLRGLRQAGLKIFRLMLAAGDFVVDLGCQNICQNGQAGFDGAIIGSLKRYIFPGGGDDFEKRAACAVILGAIVDQLPFHSRAAIDRPVSAPQIVDLSICSP